MPSLFTLVASRSAKLDFISSPRYLECLEELNHPETSEAALAALALAAREPDVASQLRADLTAKTLETLVDKYPTNALRLVAATGIPPTDAMLATMQALLSYSKPSIDQVAAALVASEIATTFGLKFDLQIGTHPPLYVAAQIRSAKDPETSKLWKHVRSPNTRLRLAAAQLLAKRNEPGLLPFVADLIPQPEACAIAAQLVESASTAQVLVDTGALARIKEHPSAEALELGATLAVSDGLRQSMLGLVPWLLDLSAKFPQALHFILALTRSVKALRQGAGSARVAERVLELVRSGSEPQREAAMAVACNLVLDVCPSRDIVLPLYERAIEVLDNDSLFFLVQCTAGAELALKGEIFRLMGVSRLLGVAATKLGLALLSNLLKDNPGAVDVWLAEAPLDLWAAVAEGLRTWTAHALWVLVHIAAARPLAVLERPNLLNRVAAALGGAPAGAPAGAGDQAERMAGIWLLFNLYHGTDGHGLHMFKEFLDTCESESAEYPVRARARVLRAVV